MSISSTFDALQHEVQELRSMAPDPQVFLESFVPILPEKELSLTDWSFLCSFMKWRSDYSFTTNQAYQDFLKSIVHATVVPASVESVLKNDSGVPAGTLSPQGSPSRSATGLLNEESVVPPTRSPRDEEASMAGTPRENPGSPVAGSVINQDKPVDQLMEGVETLSDVKTTSP